NVRSRLHRSGGFHQPSRLEPRRWKRMDANLRFRRTSAGPPRLQWHVAVDEPGAGRFQRGYQHRAGEHDHHAAYLPGQRAIHHDAKRDDAEPAEHPIGTEWIASSTPPLRALPGYWSTKASSAITDRKSTR